MKKRFISLLTVFMMIISGVFSCVASADERSTGEKLFDWTYDFITSGTDLIEDIWDFGNNTREWAKDKLKQELFGAGEAADDDTIIISDSEYSYGYLKNVSTSIYSAPQNTWCTEYISHKAGKALKCTLDPGATFVFNASCKNSYAFGYQFYYSDGTYVSGYNGMGKYNSSCRSPQTITNPFGRQMFLYVRVEVDVWPQDTTGESLATMQVTGEGDGFRWGWDTELHWSGSFNINAINDLEIDLAASRDIDVEIDGEFYIIAGILYITDTDATYASDHVRGTRLSGSGKKNWHWAFDLGEFSYYLYRKRCETDHFRAFVTVYSYKKGDYVYYKDYPFDVPKPGGIFEDTEDTPKWEDYKPDPVPMPEPPTIIFNYDSVTNNNNQTWQNFNFTTINNYTVNNGGSGGGGGSGSGDGDSSEPDPGGDNSEPDSGGDSSGDDSSSGSDPGNGGGSAVDDDFLEWLAAALQIINDNITNAYTTVNHNLGVINDNASSFFDYVGQFLDDVLTGYLDYIAELIKKFNTDFNNWTDSFSDFIGALGDTINHNITIVGDNIVKSIKTQVVPDKDNVYEIALNKFPFVSTWKDEFSNYEPESKDIIVSFPDFSSTSSVQVQLVQRGYYSNNRDGESVGSGSINTVSGNSYTYNISEALRSYGLPQFREVGSLFILGTTFWTLINITFKIFGLGFAKDYDASQGGDDL